MPLLLMVYKNKIIGIMIGGFLLIWAVTTSSLLTFKKNKVVLLKLENGSISPIQNYSEIKSNELKQIDLSFVSAVVSSFYHFDVENFDNNMSIAKGFFSEDGWRSVEGDVDKLRSETQKTFISQAAIIISAKKLSPEIFKLKLKFYTAVGGETKNTFRNITLSVRRRDIHELSDQRPYPYEVTNVIDETI